MKSRPYIEHLGMRYYEIGWPKRNRSRPGLVTSSSYGLRGHVYGRLIAMGWELGKQKTLISRGFWVPTFWESWRVFWETLVTSTNYTKTGWWQLKYFFGIFTPKIVEDEPNLTSIFFRWVETNNQIGFLGGQILEIYCWWKKSCTSWWVVYPVTGCYRSQVVQDFSHQQYHDIPIFCCLWGEVFILHSSR